MIGKKFETPTLEQLTKIASILRPELEDLKKENITIVFNLNKENLTKLDEELFFRMNPDAKMEDFEPNYEEINATIWDINFKFIEHVKN